MFWQIISYLFYVIALILFIHIIFKVRSEGLKLNQAIEAFGIVVTILIALNIPKPTQFRDISGAWSGTGKVETQGSVLDASMTLTITDNCEEGKICGQDFFPVVSCPFSLEYLGEHDGRFYFSERDTSAGYGHALETYLEPIGNNKIKYYAKGDWGETNIILESQ